MLTSIRGPIAATLALGSALAAAPALADETDPPAALTVTGNVALVSDYRFRGISLSGGDPAVQGGIAVNHASGFYAGVWASSLKDTPLYGSIETDLYAGWTGPIAAGLTADVGLTYYNYPGGHFGHANYFESSASLTKSLGPVSAKAGVAYAWKQEALGGDDSVYLYTDWGLGVPNTPISVAAHLGYTDGALSPRVLTGEGTDGGWDYSLGATYAITSNLSVGVSYVGVDGAAINGLSDDAVVGTLKLSF